VGNALVEAAKLEKAISLPFIALSDGLLYQAFAIARRAVRIPKIPIRSTTLLFHLANLRAAMRARLLFRSAQLYGLTCENVRDLREQGYTLGHPDWTLARGWEVDKNERTYAMAHRERIASGLVNSLKKDRPKYEALKQYHNSCVKKWFPFDCRLSL